MPTHHLKATKKGGGLFTISVPCSGKKRSEMKYVTQGVEPIWLEKGLFWLETTKMAKKKRQISTLVSAFSAIVGVSLKCVL